VAGISNVVVQAGLIGRLVERFGERKLAVVGLLSQAIQVAGTALVPYFWMMYLLLGVSSGTAGPFRPSSSALLSNRVSAQEQGRLNGVSTSLASLMSVFGPLLAGLAYDKVAPAAPFWIGGLLLALASAWLMVAFHRTG
jgi:DHA1 family tetracycline resistance protein-like MFS transporter